MAIHYEIFSGVVVVGKLRAAYMSGCILPGVGRFRRAETGILGLEHKGVHGTPSFFVRSSHLSCVLAMRLVNVNSLSVEHGN